LKKHVTALLAAFSITLVVGMGMFVIGGNAALNKNSAPLLDSPNASSVSTAGSTDQSQLAQLQNLVAQYQQREQQYQDQLNAAQQQLDQASATLQQYQRLLNFLVERGIIQVDQNGRIFIPGN
jgi:multidrug efflux pump subunit AcrA (membrane-fusion protein)